MPIYAPPLKTNIAGTPSNATAKAAFGELYDYTTSLLGSTGDPADARNSLAIKQPSSFRADNNNVNIATIPDATWTRIQLSTKRHDTNSEFASGRFTAKKAGPHRFYFQWSGAAPTNGDPNRARLYLNGSSIAEGRNVVIGTMAAIASVYTEVDLIIGDYIDTYVYHNRGTNQEVNGAVTFTYFTGGYIGTY